MDAIMTNLNDRVDRFMGWIDSLPGALLHRVVGAALFVPTGTVLGIAAWLTPAEKGWGTHQQLGLGGCTMLTITGWPCPMCGMTTTFTHMAHGHLIEAFVTQPFGVALFSITAIFAAIGLYDLVTARGVWRKTLAWIGEREQLLAMGLLVGMTLGWVYKSVVMHPEVFHLG